MLYRFTVGLLALLLPAQLTQLLRWLWIQQLLPPLVFGMTLTLSLVAAGIAWWEWCERQPVGYRFALSHSYPLALALLGIVFGLRL
jgi:xanthine/uracil permease